MKFTFMKIVAVGLLAVSSMPANSAIIDLLEYDYLTAGDKLITFDRNTGLQWLDVNHTQGMSIVEIEATSLLSDGWAWATTDQLLNLYDHVGISIDDTVNYTVTDDYKALIELWGPTINSGTSPTPIGDDDSYLSIAILGISRGFLSPDPADAIRGTPYTTTYLGYNSINGNAIDHCGMDDCVATPLQLNRSGVNRISTQTSYWSAGGVLVRTVPEPSSIFLIGFGFLSIWAASGKKVIGNLKMLST